MPRSKLWAHDRAHRKPEIHMRRQRPVVVPLNEQRHCSQDAMQDQNLRAMPRGIRDFHVSRQSLSVLHQDVCRTRSSGTRYSSRASFWPMEGWSFNACWLHDYLGTRPSLHSRQFVAEVRRGASTGHGRDVGPAVASFGASASQEWGTRRQQARKPRALESFPSGRDAIS